MIITETTSKDEYGSEDSFALSIDGDRGFFAYNMTECPEDATLNRDLNFVYGISDLMEKAWLAGKNGDTFEIIRIEEDDD